MRGETPAGRKTKTRLFNQPLHVARIQAAPAEANKDRRVAAGLWACQHQPIALAQIFRKRSPGVFAERNDPLFSAFAEDPNQLLTQIHVLIIETHKFANAQPARIQQFENRSIPQILERCTLRQFDNGGCFLLAEIGRQLLRQSW